MMGIETRNELEELAGFSRLFLGRLAAAGILAEHQDLHLEAQLLGLLIDATVPANANRETGIH